MNLAKRKMVMITEDDIEAINPEFYDWLNELENFSTRAERLYEDFPEVKNLKLLRGWMEAAFTIGYRLGSQGVKQPKVYVDVEV
jgi:hypothetical protein